MKKISAILLAVMLVFAVAGQASAAFENNHLVQVVHNSADKEFGVDLGDIGTIDMSGTNVLLAPVGSVNFGALGSYAELNVGFFGADTAAYQNWIATTKTTDPLIAPAQLLNFENGASSVQATYQSDPSQSYNQPGTYGSIMNLNGVAEGAYAGWNLHQADGESGLADLASTGYVDMYLYHWSFSTLDKGPDAGTDYTGILRLYANGSTVLNPSAVPIPGAAILLGSGLIGLVGIRRRNG
ncbi:MAG: VPLPA-CTERM sorting domain-containing protein [Thermodesulfobacteriota bacterium]|nr:VPLPA-CTERM sorting domain-containing protein [Thermodesulfobacteriota bacterium]